MPRGDLRVSTAERDAVVEQLRGHTSDGRLTLDEFADRVEEALAATTGNQLGHTLRELPPLAPDAARHQRGAIGRGAQFRPAGRTFALALLALLAVLAVLAVGSGHPWALFGVGWLWLRFGQRWGRSRGRSGVAFARRPDAEVVTRSR